jgi:predicted RNase H-like HicB family nuclease
MLMATATLVAYVEWDDETEMYVATVPGVQGAHTQAPSLDELRENLREVLLLCADEGWLSADDVPKFAGLQQIELSL